MLYNLVLGISKSDLFTRITFRFDDENRFGVILSLIGRAEIELFLLSKERKFFVNVTC